MKNKGITKIIFENKFTSGKTQEELLQRLSELSISIDFIEILKNNL